MKGIRIVLGVAALMATTASVAVAPLPYGWYLDANVGASKVNGVSYTSAPESSKSSDFGWNVNIGYKFIPYFGAEIGYTNYADETVKVSNVKVATATHYAYDLAAKAILPVSTTGVELFAKVGIAEINSHVTAKNSVPGVTVYRGTQHGTAMYYGLGGDWSFMPNLAANLQWNRANGNSKVGRLDLYSIGLTYLIS